MNIIDKFDGSCLSFLEARRKNVRTMIQRQITVTG